MKAKRVLMNLNHFLTRPIVVVIILLLMISFALYRQGLALQQTNKIAEHTNFLVERQRESLCLLVVHAEASPGVVITDDIRELCGDIFRVLPLEGMGDE